MTAHKKRLGSAIITALFFFLVFTTSTRIAAQATSGGDSATTDWKQFFQRSFELLKAEQYDEYAAMILPSATGEMKRTLVLGFSTGNDNDSVLGQQIAQGLFKTNSLAEAEALDSVTFVSRLLGSVLSLPGVGGILTDADLQILGAVPEGDEMLHVLYRVTMRISNSSEVSQIEVSTLRRYNNGWALTIDQEMEQMLAAIIQRIAENEN